MLRVARSSMRVEKLCHPRVSSWLPPWPGRSPRPLLAPRRKGAFGILVVEQHGLQFLAHVPFDVVGEHAQEDMGPGLGAVVDGTDLQIHGLQAAEGPFHRTQPLVGAHRAGTVELALRQAGADHVEAVEPGLGGDGSLIAPIGEDTVVVDGPREVLRHLVLADDLPLPDLPGACRAVSLLRSVQAGPRWPRAVPGCQSAFKVDPGSARKIDPSLGCPGSQQEGPARLRVAPCDTWSGAAWEVPVDPPGQPGRRPGRRRVTIDV